MITATNEDNMQMMKRYEDNFFDLAIVDPPYGIGLDKGCNTGKVGKYGSKHKPKNWDSKIPEKEYFYELFRVSKNQIVWGGNYFTKYLKTSKSWIVWDKVQPASNFASCELAWTNTNNRMTIFKYGFNLDRNKIHPTQKPVKLYEWCLLNYAKQGFKILDTHRGSASLDIACHNLGFDLWTCEIDKEYFNNGSKRLKEHQQQLTMF